MFVDVSVKLTRALLSTCASTRESLSPQGCHRPGNGQGKKFIKVREKSGNYILSQGKLTFWRRKVRGNWNNLTYNTIEGWKKHLGSLWSQRYFKVSGKDGCKFTPEAATISDILYLFGRGNCIFNSRAILTSDVFSGHVSRLTGVN